MFSKTATEKSMNVFSDWLNQADAVIIGAGAGLSTSAGFTYDGERFEQYFGDFGEKYGITDIYSGGFYPFATQEEYWAWWSRHIYYNRYVAAPRVEVYHKLLSLVKDKDYFVLTTNVDHQFQLAGFDKSRLFYTQGDYGLWQCSVPCHKKTYDNKDAVLQMIAEQKNMRIPSSLIPHCPVCGAPMTMNLRSDNTFIEDAGWDAASEKYAEFVRSHQHQRLLFLELGVGGNTPGIIKYPFWQMTYRFPKAKYVCINAEDMPVPGEIAQKAITIKGDIGEVLAKL